MSTSPPEPPPRSPDPPPVPEFDIPNAEKYMLEADVMRRRQLRSALLHGSTRTWREHRSVWPGVVAGVVVSALIIAILAVETAYTKDRENQQRAALAQFCRKSQDAEIRLLGADLDVNDPGQVADVANAARDLADAVPAHAADEIQTDLDTIAHRTEAMVDAEGRPARLARINSDPALERARTHLRTFNDEYCY